MPKRELELLEHHARTVKRLISEVESIPGLEAYIEELRKVQKTLADTMIFACIDSIKKSRRGRRIDRSVSEGAFNIINPYEFDTTASPLPSILPKSSRSYSGGLIIPPHIPPSE